MTLIREYEPADAVRLAAHFLRCGYGPHYGSSQLGANSMAAVLAERVPELFMVALDGEDIIGCIGFMRGSGRRVTRENELFAGLFVLDPRYRNSMLAGNMFVKSFEKLVALGTRAMRIEANPTNKKAFPLYLRVGFRARPDARADEDGYVELVSHLPGVVGDLLRSNIGDELEDVLPRFSWRNAAGGRAVAPTTGVTIQPDGSAVVSYDLSVADFHLRAHIAMDSGATLHHEVVSGAIGELPLHEGLDRHGKPAIVAVRALCPDTVAEVDSLGTVRIYGPGFPGPVLIDHWPIVRGATATGWRRPHSSTVHVEASEDVWRLTAKGDAGTITKDVRFGEGMMSVTSVLNAVGDRELVASPWVSMRMPEKYTVTDGEAWVGGPAVRGIWPDDFTDFEACADDIAGQPVATGAIWRNSSLAIEAIWSTDMTVRHEGNHLPQFRRPANVPITYGIKVSPGRDWVRPPEFAAPAGITREKVRRIRRTGTLMTTKARPASWQPSKRQGKDVMECVEPIMELRYSETAGGITGWSYDGREVLSSPYPSVRSWGSLADWSAGLWAGRCSPRENPEQGVEWVGGTAAIKLKKFVGDPVQDGWTLHTIDTIPAIEVAAALSLQDAKGDMAFYLTPAVAPGSSVLFGDPGAEKWVVEATSRRWSLGTSRMAVELQNGGYLVVRPINGENQEIFIRSERKGIHLSLLSRLCEAGTECRWRLSVLPHRSAALVEMDG
ncbi:GNAT family N-acetyltransferase [bacterium RCC_150]